MPASQTTHWVDFRNVSLHKGSSKSLSYLDLDPLTHGIPPFAILLDLKKVSTLNIEVTIPSHLPSVPNGSYCTHTTKQVGPLRAQALIGHQSVPSRVRRFLLLGSWVKLPQGAERWYQYPERLRRELKRTLGQLPLRCYRIRGYRSFILAHY